MKQVVHEARRERLTRVVAASSVVFSLGYIVWRWGWTLNTDALWFSVPLAVAETYGLLTAFFLTFTGWRILERRSAPPLPGRTVDVFVTTYDEPLAIIRKTALAARELAYPHETWILDDGRRDEVEAMARELGVRYVRRDSNEHAKAGNLNNALRHAQGEFILQLDADHVPLPHMIDRLIGFFADDRLAFVQSPQDFYNTDAFTYEVDAGARRMWEDQQLFFKVLQPGKDRVNAAFFVGSCALLRRAAIEDVGGFATRTITEDIETSMLLHARGWRSAYYPQSLAYGLAPANATAFHVQHLRWGQGAMQALRQYGPLRMKGLTLSQRIAYLDSLTTYLGGFQRLILYCAPLVFFVTGAFPLRVSAGVFAAVFVPYMALQWAAFKLLARGSGSLLLADRFAMAKFFTHIRSVTGYLTRRRLRFRVTPKGAMAEVPPGTFMPQLMLVLATAGALAFAVYERQWGYADEVPGWGAAAVWVNVLFALWNAWVAVSIVRLAFAGRQQRAGFRFAESLPVAVRILRADGKLAALDVAVTGDLSPAGAALRAMHPFPDEARVELTLPLSRAATPVKGRVVNRREQVTPYGTVFIHGVEFEDLSVDARDAIELHCAQHATPLERQRYDASASKWRLRNIRGEARVSVGMPAEVFVGSDRRHSLGLALLEDVSPLGARVVIDHPIQPDSIVRLAIPGTTLDTTGKVVFVHALETTLGMRFVVGINTLADASAEPAVRRGLAWFAGIVRLALRYGAAARTFAGRWRTPGPQRPTAASNDTTTAGPEAVAAPVVLALPAPAGSEPPTAVAAEIEDAEIIAIDEAPFNTVHDAVADSEEPAVTTFPQPGELHMPTVQQSLVPSQQQAADASEPVLFTVRGKSARIDGTFGDAESIEVHGDIQGDLRIAGVLVIGQQAAVNGNVTAQRIRVEGEFTGDLRAVEDIEIAPTGVVNGTLKCDEFVIERGGVFNGTATRTQQNAAQQNAQAQQAPAARDRSRRETQAIASPRTTLADVAVPPTPAASVLEFGDDEGFEDYQGRQVPLA